MLETTPGETGGRPTLGAMLKEPYLQIQKRSYRLLAEGGHPDITPAHSGVFRNISPNGSRVSDMASDAGITKQSMGYLVETLKRMGYVRLADDPEDGRAKLVFLTESGEEVVQRLQAMSMDLQERIRAEMGVDWLTDLQAKLEQLEAWLGQAGDNENR